MSELLGKWINDQVGLSRPISSFEVDFSNGYYVSQCLDV